MTYVTNKKVLLYQCIFEALVPVATTNHNTRL